MNSIVDQQFSNSNDGNDLVARYEELRSRALGEKNISGSERGFVLLLRRGMSAWMSAWSECVLGYDAHPQEERGGGTVLPVGLRSEVATVLVGMALSAATG